MKRFLNKLVIGAAAISLFGCTPSSIQESNPDDMMMPDGVVIERNPTAAMTLPESSSYTIPDDAPTGENGGPGAMATTAVDYSYYPEDKRPSESAEEQGTMIIIYIPGPKGITTSFDYVDTCDAESELQALKNNNAITESVELVSFEVNDAERSAVLEISEAASVYAAASEEEVVAAVANTFIDNFSLDEIDMIVGGEDLGYMGFSQEFDE